MKYLHYFETTSAFETERNGNYREPWVSYTSGKGLDYNKPKFSSTLKSYLRSFSDANHVVGIMPEFPCQIDFDTWNPAYQEYYPNNEFLVNESGWGWCPINSINDTWILNKIENIDWSDCYGASNYANNYNIYVFRILYDNYAHTSYYDEQTDSSREEGYILIMEDNGTLSIINSSEQLEEITGDSQYSGGSVSQIVSDTSTNTSYYATRYYEW